MIIEYLFFVFVSIQDFTGLYVVIFNHIIFCENRFSMMRKRAAAAVLTSVTLL